MHNYAIKCGEIVWGNMKDLTKITQRDIPNLPNGTHRIDAGFYIRVRDTGRNFFFRAQIDGHRKDIAIGSAKTMSLASAKAKVLQLKARIANNENVLQAEQKKPQEPSVPTFNDFAFKTIQSIAQARRWKNKKHGDQWINTVRTYAVPVLGKKRMDKIDREDILKVLKPIWETKTETAYRLQNRLAVIFSYAIVEGYCKGHNPAAWEYNLEMYLPSPSALKERKHHEAMTSAEAADLVSNKLQYSKFSSHKAVLFGMLTACRASEFLHAKWEEIDFENKVFSVPPERRKDKKNYPHRVPLSNQAIDLLKSIGVGEGLIFPSKKGEPAYVDVPRVTLRRLVKRPVTMHGCRSTFRDWCAENGKDSTLAEKSLMHATGNEVEQAYQRSDLLEQRRVLMQEWADFLYSAEIE